MCGIAGLLGPPGDPSARVAMATRMATTLAHRGPDDSGAWSDERGVVGLGFRRLSIIDLSPAGHQPMSSADGRYTVVFNGEIYNFAAHPRGARSPPAARSAAGRTRRSSSRRSATGASRRPSTARGACSGSALWDAHERVLHLVRDRLGKKPLYYGWQGDTFLFGSELKALRADPHFRAPGSTATRWPATSATPTCRHRGPSTRASTSCRPAATWMVRPGSPRRAAPSRGGTGIRPPSAANGQADRSGSRTRRRSTSLETLLGDAVRLRSYADVPLGAFLSGGIDSSTVVAVMQANSTRAGPDLHDRLRSVRVRRVEPRPRPSPTTSAHDHTELQVTPGRDPGGHPAPGPTCTTSRSPTPRRSRPSSSRELARQNVTVALSGDGGDEVFGGYNRYVTGMRLWSRLSRRAATGPDAALARGDGGHPAARLGRAREHRRPGRCRGSMRGR